MSDIEKKYVECPFCGEDILSTAIKCKHCGADLSGQIVEDKIKEIADRLSKEYLSDSSAIYVSPNIPDKYIKRAREKYLTQNTKDSDIVVLGEIRALGYFVCGFVITPKQFFYYGVNDYTNFAAGARKETVPLREITSLDIKDGGAFKGYGHLILNGNTPDDSKIVPKNFDFGKKENKFLRQFFSELLPAISEYSQFDSGTSMGTSSLEKKIEDNKEKKPGCFKSGCLAIIGLVLLGLAILFIVSGL